MAREKLPFLTKANVKTFLLVNLGVLLLTCGVYFFKLPNHFSTAGSRAWPSCWAVWCPCPPPP